MNYVKSASWRLLRRLSATLQRKYACNVDTAPVALGSQAPQAKQQGLPAPARLPELPAEFDESLLLALAEVLPLSLPSKVGVPATPARGCVLTCALLAHSAIAGSWLSMMPSSSNANSSSRLGWAVDVNQMPQPPCAPQVRPRQQCKCLADGPPEGQLDPVDPGR